MGLFAQLPTLPYIPGRDGSGTIEKVGSQVETLKVCQIVLTPFKSWFSQGQTRHNRVSRSFWFLKINWLLSFVLLGFLTEKMFHFIFHFIFISGRRSRVFLRGKRLLRRVRCLWIALGLPPARTSLVRPRGSSRRPLLHRLSRNLSQVLHNNHRKLVYSL
jgi:hypothetical protein